MRVLRIWAQTAKLSSRKIFKCEKERSNNSQNGSNFLSSDKSAKLSSRKKPQNCEPQKFVPAKNSSLKVCCFVLQIDTNLFSILLLFSECKDRLGGYYCAAYQQQGYCSTRRDTMIYYCSQTCGFCDGRPNFYYLPVSLT